MTAERLAERIRERVAVFQALGDVAEPLSRLAACVADAFRRGRKLLLFGNGGSAADCQHLAAEFVNRLDRDRVALPAIALTTDASVLTSVANDTAFEQVFVRQIAALGREGDVALGLSTSGTSPNVLAALSTARQLGMVTALMTGARGRGQGALVDHLLVVPAEETQCVQEAHEFLGHVLCELVEEKVMGKEQRPNGVGDEKQPGYFVHPSSYIDDNVEIGEGTKIWYFCHVQSGARIGRNCILGQNVNIDRDAVVGDRVKIQNNVSVYKGVVVEDDVFLGPSMVLTNVVNPRSHVSRKHEFKETRIRKGATIGANATIVCGHTIGRYAFVGAGAVVTSDIPDYGLVVGNPARLVGWMCQCGVKLTFEAAGEAGDLEKAVCNDCGARYLKRGTTVVPVDEENVT